MFTLEKYYKVMKLNRKTSGIWRLLEEGSIMKVEFAIEGSYHQSPMIKIYIDGDYIGDKYCSDFYKMFINPPERRRKGEWHLGVKLAELEDVEL